ncbi:unnamed protein product, partial [Urochloa humidicola]
DRASRGGGDVRQGDGDEVLGTQHEYCCRWIEPADEIILIGNLILDGKASTFSTSSGKVKVFVSPVRFEDVAAQTGVTWFRFGRLPPLGLHRQRRRQYVL